MCGSDSCRRVKMTHGIMYGMQATYRQSSLSTFIAFIIGSLFLIAPLLSVHAITDTFTVQTMVGADTTPPSIPTNLVVTPIAPTQIDLQWNPSTDDWMLGGYHVWRDDILIATTTATTYADTGLTASTTYRYYVTAFDSVFNESASSTEVSTTTPNPPSPPVEEEEVRTTYGTRLSLGTQLLSLEVIPSQYGAVLRYTTRDAVRGVVRYGESTAYEIGSLHEQAFLRTHETNVTGLRPSTTYTFSVEGELINGRYGVMHTGTFTTLPVDDVFAPGNVMNLSAEESSGGVILTWENPNDVDFDRVRILRSDRFYPNDSADGWLVYEGNGEAAYDDGAARSDGWRYYTVFAYDSRGNVSSGAVTAILIGNAPPPQIDTATTTPITLTFFNLHFSQEGERIMSDTEHILIDGSKQLTVSLPYGAVPEHLKTIILEVRDDADPSRKSQFLLRVDASHVAYTATLAPFGIVGTFPITLTVYDFATREIGRVHGTLDSRIESDEVFDEATFFQYIVRTTYIVVFLIVLIALVFLGRRLLRTSW